MNYSPNQCPSCDSEHIIKKGKRFTCTKKAFRQIYHCNDCKVRFAGKIQYVKTIKEFKYVSKPVPSQNWSAYTKAQNQHKQGLMDISIEMLDLIEIKNKKSVGRPNSCLKEICFALILKTFTNLSARRLHSELEFAKQLGYIKHVLHFTVLMKYLGSAELAILLKELLKLSSLPIKQMSSKTFSADSTGYSTSQFSRWFDYKYDKEKVMKDWIKCHIMIENKSNVVVHAIITDGHAGDSPRFEKLVTKTNENFEIKEVYADKAYSSRRNLEIVAKVGGQAFIPFKKNVSGKKIGSFIWRQTYQYFKNNPQSFYEHYHLRSNAETSFSMTKSKFSFALRSKNFAGQQNEIFLKLICHNISCLIHEYYEKNIESYLPTQVPKIRIPCR